MTRITSTEELQAIYGAPVETSLAKEVAHITPHYRKMIEASPFVALATAGPEGLDCSPRGDMAGFVRIHDDHTVMMPDRKGNNRVDSLRNIIRIIIAIILPPLGVFLQVGIGGHFWLNILLTILGYIPGIVHAVWVIAKK